MYIHQPAKHRRSGSTMQKVRARGQHSKFVRNRAVLPGFPKGPFADISEVRAYVSGERIACLICGKEYKTLLIHVAKIHDLDETQYRERFNIQCKYALVGSETRERLSEHAKRNPHTRDAARIALLQKGRRHSARRAPTKTTFTREQNIARLAGRRKGPLVADNCEWHLEQVRKTFNFKAVEPPPGCLSWSGYKKRRVADPGLNARHRAARAARPTFDIDAWREGGKG